MPCGYKLSPAAQKRGFACRSMFQKGLPQKSHQRVFREPCIFTPSVMMSDLTTPPPCLRQATVSRGRARAAAVPTHWLRTCAGALCFYSLRLSIGRRRMMSQLPRGGAWNKEFCRSRKRHLGSKKAHIMRQLLQSRFARQLPQRGSQGGYRCFLASLDEGGGSPQG